MPYDSFSTTPNPYPDFEEAFRVIKLNDTHYKGAHPLRLPVRVGRGVYGGHLISQSLLVAIESTRDPITNRVFIPDSYHCYFIGAGNDKYPMSYTVTKIFDNETISKRYILAHQNHKNKLSCLVTLRKPGTRSLHDIDINIPVSKIQEKYPDPDKLHQIQHTDFVRNAYSKEFIDYRECPEEKSQYAAERWLTVFAGLKNQPEPGAEHVNIVEHLPNSNNEIDLVSKSILRPHDTQSFRDPLFNYVGLANLTDSAFITTMPRVLHLPWNPTIEKAGTYDSSRDALLLMRSSLNILHIFHYNAMSLDHHIYFHNDDYDPDDDSAFDVCKEWLTFTYQMKRLSNSRLLCRGYFFNKNKKCVATVIQEGLTLVYSGVGDTVDHSRL
ncbi:hypothetical protein JA1_000495 [Spathaspora sp. JA1]|nr:hypothetical protein JA1_000495 [Spathaspora sp. JA1]